MPVPSAITDLSTTAASNYPAGTDSPSTLDDVQRAHASFIAQLRDGSGFTAGALNALVTAPSAVASVNGGQLAGLRNRIINGGMAIDQRNNGAAQTFTAGAALAYCIDRWYGYCTGANVTGQRVAGSGTTQYRYQFSGAASVTKIGYAQRIEAANSFDLNGRAITVGVELANSLLTTVTWTAYYATTADTFGTLASPTRTQIGSGTVTVTSTPTRYYIPITLPAAATTGIEIEFSVGAQVSGTWSIGEAQLVAGSASELWREQRPIGMELGLCPRSYCKSYSQANVPGAITSVNQKYIQRTNSTAADGFDVRWPMTMRTTPNTINLYSPATGATSNIYDSSGAVDTAATVNNAGDGGFNVGWSATVARPYIFHFIASAEL